MSKRKAPVNDIIYELDNDDIEISSEDEVKQSKHNRLDLNKRPDSPLSDSNTQSSCLEVVDIDSSVEKVDDVESPKLILNGGKSPDEFIIIDEASFSGSPNTSVTERNKKLNSDTIYNEDIIVDSPASNSGPEVVGCENRRPLITVTFRDRKLAMNYKKKIKDFMLSLVKLHENSTDSENETDLELDIWPEELADNFENEPENDPEDNMFFIDTDPCVHMPDDIPSYSQNSSMISNVSEEKPSPPKMRRKGPICFNCDGDHVIRDCTQPRNNAKIAESRKFMTKIGRYHVEDEQKYGHLVPGRISGALRHALGLKRHELPLHIYRMRQMGYPPGWLEEARISHSGITLFDSSGQATLDPEEEEGEVWEPGSKDKFDIKKILDFPGFNVPASSRYKEEGHKLGLPPMSDQDSKMSMLQVLAPNAMKAYKRKKLTFFPSAPGQAVVGAAEMEIDSGDEVADFPSQPPLPDDAPPPPPPPPANPPPPPPKSPSLPPPEKLKNDSDSKTDHDENREPAPIDNKSTDQTKVSPQEIVTSNEKIETSTEKNETNTDENGTGTEKNETTTEKNEPSVEKTVDVKKTESEDDLEVVAVMKVKDIPVPKIDLITIDSDADVSEQELIILSPSLDDLEKKKRLLLDALGTEEGHIVDTENQDEQIDEVVEPTEDTVESIENDKVESVEKDTVKTAENDTVNTVENDTVESVKNDIVESPDNAETLTESAIDAVDDKVEDGSVKKSAPSLELPKDSPKINKSINTDDAKTPVSIMGHVRETEYGTPVMNIASPYMKLPSDDKFAKDICDVINFENLPNSTGKYKKISTLLKKVKSEVDRIQDS